MVFCLLIVFVFCHTFYCKQIIFIKTFIVKHIVLVEIMSRVSLRDSDLILVVTISIYFPS